MGAREDERSLIGCRELGEPRQRNIFFHPRLWTDDPGEDGKAVAPGGRLMLTVQLAKAFLLAEAVELGGDDGGGGLVGGACEL